MHWNLGADIIRKISGCNLFNDSIVQYHNALLQYTVFGLMSPKIIFGQRHQKLIDKHSSIWLYLFLFTPLFFFFFFQFNSSDYCCTRENCMYTSNLMQRGCYKLDLYDLLMRIIVFTCCVISFTVLQNFTLLEVRLWLWRQLQWGWCWNLTEGLGRGMGF